MAVRRIALTRAVSPRFAECELTHLARTPIDVARAVLHHAGYEALLRTLGCEVRRVRPAPDHPDGVFVEDAAVVLPELVILTRPGAASRRPEVDDVAAALAEVLAAVAPGRPVARIAAPAILDGGDVLAVGRTIFVGRTSRSDAAGVAQLRSFAAPHGYDVRAIEVTGCLHLKSAATALDDGTLLVNPAWVVPEAFAPFATLAVHPEEPAAANVLRIGDALVLAEEHPRTRAIVEAFAAGRGLAVHAVPAGEIAKAEGAVTCCSVIVEA